MPLKANTDAAIAKVGGVDHVIVVRRTGAPVVPEVMVPLVATLAELDLIKARIDEIVTRTPPQGAAVVHMLQATGLLWTARRAAGRAMQRLPMDPNWDSGGMRMELVR